ncbi:MAG: hypothetical protein R2849_06595 [Thermomicrobiales bacterium]
MASYLNRDYPASTEHYERAVSLFRDLETASGFRPASRCWL